MRLGYVNGYSRDGCSTLVIVMVTRGLLGREVGSIDSCRFFRGAGGGASYARFWVFGLGLLCVPRLVNYLAMATSETFCGLQGRERGRHGSWCIIVYFGGSSMGVGRMQCDLRDGR